MTDLGTLGGDGSWNWALGINNHGQAVITNGALLYQPEIREALSGSRCRTGR